MAEIRRPLFGNIRTFTYHSRKFIGNGNWKPVFSIGIHDKFSGRSLESLEKENIKLRGTSFNFFSQYKHERNEHHTLMHHIVVLIPRSETPINNSTYRVEFLESCLLTAYKTLQSTVSSTKHRYMWKKTHSFRYFKYIGIIKALSLLLYYCFNINPR